VPAEKDMGFKFLQRFEDEGIRAFLSEGTEFKGVLTFEGTLRIDGKFEGEILGSGTLIVGQSGVINADITASMLISRGKITGTVNVTKQVVLHAESELLGNIKTGLLTVEEGAVFDGQCQMMRVRERAPRLVAEDLERHRVLTHFTTLSGSG